ncbi:hypothetical protein JCM7447_03840 [Corynebacterium amycolatum]
MGGDDIGYPPDYYVSAGELKIEFCGGEKRGEARSTSPRQPLCTGPRTFAYKFSLQPKSYTCLKKCQ